MTIQELELELKSINPDFSIRINPNATEIAGLYWKDYCAYIAMPAKEIFRERREDYRDEYGHIHRSADEVILMAQNFLHRIETEPEFKDLVTTNDEIEGISKPNIKLK